MAYLYIIPVGFWKMKVSFLVALLQYRVGLFTTLVLTRKSHRASSIKQRVCVCPKIQFQKDFYGTQLSTTTDPNFVFDVLRCRCSDLAH